LVFYRKFVPLQLQKFVLNLIAISVKPVITFAITSHETQTQTSVKYIQRSWYNKPYMWL